MRQRHGFTLIETIIFITIFPLLTAILAQIFFSEVRAWTRARAERNAVDAGQVILERLTQEIRLATSVDTAQSAIGGHPGRLVLHTFATPTASAASLLDISLSGTNLTLSRSGSASTTISGSARVTELVFYRLATSSSEAVKIDLTLQTGQGDFLTEKQFTTAAVLRGSY